MSYSYLTSANKIKDLDWDDLCLNPYRDSLEQGRQEGQGAGLAARFQEGRSVGVVKGVEYGMEIGFMCGVVQVVINELNSESLGNIEVTQRERVQKTAVAISDLLNTSSQPDQLCGCHQQGKTTMNQIRMLRMTQKRKQVNGDLRHRTFKG
jgi:hypothetical protein